MNGVDPYAFMQRAAGRLSVSQDPAELERLQDDLEYLYEVLDPELQGLADQLMGQLVERIAELRRG
jgi:hypothetical protein